MADLSKIIFVILSKKILCENMLAVHFMVRLGLSTRNCRFGCVLSYFESIDLSI